MFKTTMTLTPHAIKRNDWIILVLVIFCAIIMRFGDAGIVEFFHDDAMLSDLAQQMASGERFPLTGINSSVGIPNPPTSVYMMAIPFAINSNPMVAIYFVMGLNVIGVALLWWIGQRYFGRTAALVAGLSYALSPWATLFSRKIWAQDYHTPLILLAIAIGLYGLWEAQPNHKRQAIAQAIWLPIILFAFQIHFASWAIAPIVAIIYWGGRNRIQWRIQIITAFLCVLVFVPYLIGLNNTLQSDPSRISAAINRSESRDAAPLTIEPLLDLSYLVTGLGMETWIAPQQQTEMNQAIPPLYIWVFIALIMLIGLAYLTWKQTWFALMLVTWGLLPSVSLVPNWTDIYPHYFIPSIPAWMLLAGIGIDWLTRIAPVKPYGRTITLGAFLFLLLTQGMYWRGVLRFVDEIDIAYPGFTIPLHYLETIEAELESAQDVVVLAQGMSWDLHHESVVWPVLLRDTATCVRTLVGDGYAVFPKHPFMVIQTPSMPENAINGLYFNDTAQHFPDRIGSPGYTLYQWQSAPQWDGETITPIEPARFEMGVQLTGYALSTNRLVLEWQLPAPMDSANYQYSSQFYDAEGNRVAQRDGVFWHGRHWCADDRLLTWVNMEIPTTATSLWVALYRLGNANEPAYINAMVVDPSGQPIDNHVAIPITDEQ